MNMNKEPKILIKKQKHNLSYYLLRPFYLILKKDMIKRLSKKHGKQFIDDVMKTFDIPTNLMNK
jgi:hypothetical protein